MSQLVCVLRDNRPRGLNLLLIVVSERAADGIEAYFQLQEQLAVTRNAVGE